MPHNALKWQTRIKAVEREQTVTRLAADRLLAAVAQNPDILRGLLGLRDVHRMSRFLEGTYLIRLFAEFESGLRAFWRAIRTTAPPSKTRDLIDGVAATCRVLNLRVAKVHAVRDYRNALAHQRDGPIQPVPIADARNRLNEFLHFLASRW